VLPAAAAEPINVALDQATVLQLPDRAKTVVVGNPLIADLSVQPGGLAVVTAKGYGATNFIALDRNGEDRRGEGAERPDRRGLSRPDAADL
jgi:Flp pilus assembly secretin CpaC